VQCHEPEAAERAVQLDLRPGAESRHRSVFVAWDSRLVHQGHTHGAGVQGWQPSLHRPPFFGRLREQAWKPFLAEEGYVAIADPLPGEDVDEALRLLLQDLRRLAGGDLRHLGEVRKQHLPNKGAHNDLRMAGGLCHGAFAWFLRGRPQIACLFEALFGLPAGAPMTGSVDVVALAPPSCPMAREAVGKRWLHLDYSPPQGQIYQASIQLFPEAEEFGGRWERIALMICKAPAQWTHPIAEHALLACCVAGAPSRATAGVTLGKMHRPASYGAKGEQRRLLPELADAPLAVGEGLPPRAPPPPEDDRVPDEDVIGLLRWYTPGELMRHFPAEDLRRLLPPSVAHYVSPRTFVVAAAAPLPRPPPLQPLELRRLARRLAALHAQRCCSAETGEALAAAGGGLRRQTPKGWRRTALLLSSAAGEPSAEQGKSAAHGLALLLRQSRSLGAPTLPLATCRGAERSELRPAGLPVSPPATSSVPRRRLERLDLRPAGLPMSPLADTSAKRRRVELPELRPTTGLPMSRLGFGALGAPAGPLLHLKPVLPLVLLGAAAAVRTPLPSEPRAAGRGPLKPFGGPRCSASVASAVAAAAAAAPRRRGGGVNWRQRGESAAAAVPAAVAGPELRKRKSSGTDASGVPRKLERARPPALRAKSAWSTWPRAFSSSLSAKDLQVLSSAWR